MNVIAKVSQIVFSTLGVVLFLVSVLSLISSFTTDNGLESWGNFTAFLACLFSSALFLMTAFIATLVLARR